MTKEFIPYEQALALKKLGFNEPCFATWRGEILEMSLQIPSDHYFTQAPTFWQAFRFFREKCGLYPHIFSEPNERFVWCVRWYVDKLQKDIPYESSPTYEEAEHNLLIKLIEIAKQNSQKYVKYIE
jgi:hypothetical protein